jgi:predicted short-subunit dehydrogenase-like oxidoreductase (DUF2520 family)
MQSVTIVGAGRAGGALGIALERAGYTIDQFVVRGDGLSAELLNRFKSGPLARTWESLDKIESDYIFIATQDSEIASAALHLRPLIHNGAFVFHTSGSLSSNILDELKTAGCHVGSVHPLVSISDPVRGAEKFANAWFCVEGDVKAVTEAEGVVRNLGGNPFSVDTKYKALYHAAAVTGAGHVAALLSLSLKMLNQCGIEGITGREILKPLVKSTFDNFFELGPEKALTGPFARADAETFERQVEAIREYFDKNMLETYLLLAVESLEIAAERHRQPEKFAEMHKNVLMEKNRVEC